jgi:capsular polysaccharide biosynthesis protein
MQALLEYAVRRTVGRPALELESLGRRMLTVHPASRKQCGRAIFLDGQLERIEAVQERTTREAELARVLGSEVEHAATVVYELTDVTIAAGSAFASGAHHSLRPFSLGGALRHPATETLERAALSCSAGGYRYFGHWLTDDCTLQMLAAEYAPPVVIEGPVYPHEPGYRQLWNLPCHAMNYTRVRTLFVFKDIGQHLHKRKRYEKLRAMLADRVRSPLRRGVYLRRGSSGVRRFLANEPEVEERLSRRGFIVLDPTASSVDELVQACVGSPCIVSVEGSALAHGLMAAADEGSLVAIQPPFRFNNVFKDYTDCIGLKYAFVVGERVSDSFRVDLDELERTLDLCGQA